MLKRTFPFLLFLLLLVPCVYPVYAQGSAQALFDEANEALEDNNFSEAITAYKDLEDRNTISGGLFLNMGIAYLRLDSLGYAKYYFMKAGQFEETEVRAEEALEFVESRFSRQSAVLPKLPWDVAVEWLQDHLGATTLLGIAVLLLNTGVIIFVAKWFFTGFSRIFHFSGLIITGLALLLVLTSFYTSYVSDRYSTAVLITGKTPVVEQPRGDAALISQAYEGYTFTVDHFRSKEHPGWTYVRMSNGLYGWIPGSDIRVL